MSISNKDVIHVAKLSALELSESEVPKSAGELSDILGYVERLSEVNTRGVVPTSHVHGLVNFFREDIIKDSLPVEEIEKFAPEFKVGCFRVPKIIG